MENNEKTEPVETAEEKQIETTTNDGKNIAIIAHITIIGLIVAFIMNNDKKYPFATYHIGQMLGLSLTGLVLSFINIIPILGQIAWFLAALVMLYMWIVGLLNAVNGKEKPMPILGKKYQEWFKNL